MVEISWGTFLLLAGGAYLAGIIVMLAIVLTWTRRA
jgi:hypothetical protein